MSRDTRCLVSWEEFQKKEFEETAWLVEPYIARAGITFLWGETSTGKSPLGWHLAAAIGRGDNFCGLPAYQGKVLYLELDTPQRLVHERLKALRPAPGVDFLFLPPLSAPQPQSADQAMLDQAAAEGYDLVVVNTLRKAHSLNDKEPQTVAEVYSYFQHQFPGAALLFVHHTKKTQVDANGNHTRTKENFSGAMNWLNDAQIGLALQRHESELEGINLRLSMEKSQISQLYGPLGLFLDPKDGSSLTCPKFEQLYVAYELRHGSALQGGAFDKELARILHKSESTAYRLRQIIEHGAFPGVEWLGRKDVGAESGS